MKNSKKGFVKPLIIAVVGVIAIGGIYIASVKNKSEVVPGKPFITSLSPVSGPMGTKIELKGYYLLDRRGDQRMTIENSKGETATIPAEFIGREGENSNISGLTSFLLSINEKMCTDLPSDKGGCSGYLTIIPGAYKIYVATNIYDTDKAVSNGYTFTVTSK